MARAHRSYILPLLILMAAAFLRFYQLDAIPPGLFHDEAMNGVDALDAIYNDYHPLYFERNQGGREPLFIYLTTAAIYVLGATPFAMRLVSAFIGILTIAATYAIAKNFIGYRPAWVASALLALSQWHIHFSRTSFRAISFPLLEILALFLLWKGVVSGRNRFFALGGLMAGLSMYTYFSSRLLPILLALFLGYLAVFYRQKVSWKGIGLYCVIGLLVVLPLGYYYLSHQYIFFARIAQVSAISLAPQSDSLASLWENTANTLGMFHDRGDPNWKYNLPGKPLFDVATFSLFTIGLALSVYRARRHPPQALMIIWLVVMLLPGALSIESPSFLRVLGIVPVVFILPALAVDALWSRLAGLLKGGRTVSLWPLILAVGVWLASLGGVTFHDYFLEWGTNKETYYAFSTEMTEVGRYLNSIPDGDLVLLSSKYYQHPSVLFFLQKPMDIKWFNGSQSLVFPETERETVYVFPYSATPSYLDEFFSSDDIIAEESGPGGTTAFVAYRPKPTDLRRTLELAIPKKIGDKSFGENIELLGYRAGKEVKPGDILPLDVLWKVRQKPGEVSDLAFFSHLVDHKGQMWGLGDANEYLSPEWTVGDVVLGRYDLKVQPDTPPGRYLIDIGVYDRRSGDRLFLSGKEKLDHLLLSLVKVQQIELPPPSSIQFPTSVSLSHDIKLLGYALSDEADRPVPADGKVKAGAKLKVKLYWLSNARQDDDYTVFLHLLDDKGKVAAQDDSQPAENRFPTTFWDPNETVSDEHLLTLEPSLPPGQYTLAAGMYLLKTGERLSVLKDGKAVADKVILGNVSVEAK